MYVVIGGASGLGAAWTEYMIRTYQAHIIWLGRREQDTEISEQIARMGASAPRYIQADITDSTSLQQAYDTIKDKHAVIHGVVHSALVLADKSLQQMDESTFQASLAPKVAGTVYLAEIFGQDKLDFMPVSYTHLTLPTILLV